MPIEFRCGNCEKTLSVPDDAAGRTAQCPSCGQVQQVPAATARQEFAAGDFVPPTYTSDNPYQAPQSLEGAYPSTVVTLDPGSLLSRAWELYTTNLGACLAVVFIALAAQLVMGGLIGILAVMMESAGNDTTVIVIMLSVMGVLGLTLMLLLLWLQCGQILFWLKLAQGRDARVGDVFRGAPYMLPMLVMSLLWVIFGGLGMCTCGILSVFLAISYSPAPFLVVDRGMGAMDALRAAYDTTLGHRWQIVLIVLISFGMMMACAFIPFVGFIAQAFLTPLVMLMWALMYLVLTGQPTATTGKVPPIPPAMGT